MTDKLEKLTAEEGKSLDIEAQNIEQLKQLFPDVFRENKVDFDALKAVLGEHVEDKEERYNFTWHGKNKARQIAQTPSTGTLRPCKEESVNWDSTQNLFIEGDNLEVLKLLQKSYHQKVKMIYIDPPYNTGSDFIYKDNFSDNIKAYLDFSKQADTKGVNYSANPDTGGRFHTNWLNMMYPRLKLARNLLHENGVILASIGDHELNNLISLMNEVFGEENRVAIFTWKSRAKPTNAGNSKYRPQKVAEYVLVYAKKPVDDLIFNVIPAKERTYPHVDEDGRYRTTTILTSNRGTFRRETMRFESGGFKPDEDYRWKAGKETVDKLFSKNRIKFNEDGIPMEKKYQHEEKDPLYPIYTFMDSDLTGTAETGKSDLNFLIGNKHGLDTVKPVQLIKYFVATFTEDRDIIMDFFAGSCTTSQAVCEINLEQNSYRRFIVVQVPEAIPSSSEANVAGFKKLTDIGKRRLFEFTKNYLENDSQKPLLGYKVFKLDETNIKAWEASHDNLSDWITNSTESIKTDREDIDTLFEILLKYGLDLSLSVTEHEFGENVVFEVAHGALMVCLSNLITIETVEAIGKLKQELDSESTRVVFKDSGFADDAVKVNAIQLLKQYGIDDVKSI